MNKLVYVVGMTLLTLGINMHAVNAEPAAQVTKSAAAAQSAQKIQLNKATLEQLESIPGLGKKKAQAVLDYIKENGAIKNQAQLTEVKGIGEKLAAKISPYVNFN